jgi:predicted Zn-dependent protease
LLAVTATALALACAPSKPSSVVTPVANPTPATPESDARAEAAPVLVREDDGFLMPNAEDVDGAPAYIHYAREDMPIRVNVELPRLAARYASRDDTDAAVVAAIREWETAIKPAVPWFALEIVRDDPTADIQVEWKTRILGSAAGWGGIGWEMVDGKLRARGQFQYATKPCLDIACQLDLAELKLLVAHEFGHTLGLGHCLDCDSAMNYSWQTAERTVVTEIDVRTIKALYEIPSGTRVDGTLMIPLRGSAAKAQ